ncbi:SPOR domain-containing protein [Pseudomonas sp. ZT5P21]
MSVVMLNKMHMNGYDVLSVNNGPWRVCTQGDRLGAFGSREEALAFAASLPGYKARTKRPSDSRKTQK